MENITNSICIGHRHKMVIGASYRNGQERGWIVVGRLEGRNEAGDSNLNAWDDAERQQRTHQGFRGAGEREVLPGL